MGLEYLLSRLAHHDTHDPFETVASLGVAVGQSSCGRSRQASLAVPFAFVYKHRLFDFSPTPPIPLAALSCHRVRLLLAAPRVAPDTLDVGDPFGASLDDQAELHRSDKARLDRRHLGQLPVLRAVDWIGFHPLAMVAMLSVNLLYQFFIHTELVSRLGPLEWVLNTPAHHRVHHASNQACLDKNFGGILIVFDRLFGSFAEAPSGEALRYGLVHGVNSYNPVRIALGEWRNMFRDFVRAPTLRQRSRRCSDRRLDPQFRPPPTNSHRRTSDENSFHKSVRSACRLPDPSLLRPLSAHRGQPSLLPRRRCRRK